MFQFAGARNKSELVVQELDDLINVKLPNDAWRDHKKLTKYLQDVEYTVNKLLEGSKRMMDVFSNEILARPTYAEQYNNFRINVHKVDVPHEQQRWENFARHIPAAPNAGLFD